MRRPFQVRSYPLLLIALALLAGCQSSGDTSGRDIPDSRTGPAPLFKNLGDLHYPVSTKSPLAQRYFDQGLTLAYAFNHAEAARSFRAAQQVDPDCAMAYWGEAYVLGPNINAPMKDEAVPPTWAAVQQAIALAGERWADSMRRDNENGIRRG